MIPMNKALLRFSFSLLILAIMGLSAGAEERFATINLRKVFDKYWKTKQAEALLQDRAEDMEKEHQNMLNDYKKARDDYQDFQSASTDQALSAVEREQRKKLSDTKLKHLKDAEETIVQYQKQCRSTLEDQKRLTAEKIVAEIRIVVAAKAQATGYVVVVDTSAESANRAPIVLFSTNEKDLTDAVLSQLNSTAPAETSKPQRAEPDSKASAK